MKRSIRVAVADDHLFARRHQIDVVRADGHAVLRDRHGHIAVPCDQLVHQAAEVGREVLDDDERHARVLWEVPEEANERIEPSCRRPDPNDEAWSYGCFTSDVAGILICL